MLLNWIRRTLSNRRRAIFRFWDGTRWRAIDPMVAYRGLDAHAEFSWEEHPLLIEAALDGQLATDPGVTRVAWEALGITAAAVRDVFAIPVFDGRRGLTEEELLNLLCDFSEYVRGVKKNISPPPISRQPTGPGPSSESIKSADSESGSIDTEPNAGGP